MKFFNWFNKKVEPVYEYEWLLFEHSEENYNHYCGVHIEYLTDKEIASYDVKYKCIKLENTKRIRW
jgi:hypothetical protein